MKKILFSAAPVLGIIVDVLLIVQLTVALCGHFCKPKVETSHGEENEK